MELVLNLDNQDIEPIIGLLNKKGLNHLRKIRKPVAHKFAPGLLPNLVTGLQRLMGQTFTFSRVYHATLTDSSETELWIIEGKINGTLTQVIIEIVYIDLHFFLFESMCKTSGEILFSAPISRVPVRPCLITTSADSLALLRREFGFLRKRIKKTVPEKVWELYRGEKFKEAYKKIAVYMKKIKRPLSLAFYTLWAAWIAEKAKLLEKSIDLYEKAASLFGLLDMPWFSHFCLQRLLELKEPGTGVVSDVSAKMRAALPQVPPEMLATPTPFDYDHFRVLLKKALNARTNDEKKKTLEKLATFLFSSIDKSISVLPNVRTSTEEIDLLLKNESTAPFWQRLGSPIFVECKNWSTPVGTNVLRDFKGKMETQGIRNGILISVAGITGDSWRGAKAYLKEQKMIGYFIILLDQKDLEEIALGRLSPAEKISEKYYWLFRI